MAAIVALVSQIIFALPITVIGSNYATAFREQARLDLRPLRSLDLRLLVLRLVRVRVRVRVRARVAEVAPGAG